MSFSGEKSNWTSVFLNIRFFAVSQLKCLNFGSLSGELKKKNTLQTIGLKKFDMNEIILRSFGSTLEHVTHHY